MNENRTGLGHTCLLAQYPSASLKLLSVGVVLLVFVTHAAYGLGSASFKGQSRETQILRQTIKSMIDGPAKQVKFVYEGKYDRERQIVRKIEGIAEYEKEPGGRHEKARVGIALEDLNNDGREDVLACIHHPAFDTSGSCVLFLFINRQDGSWRELRLGPFGGNIFVLSTKHEGYKDIIFQRQCRPLRPGDPVRESCRETSIMRYYGNQYSSFMSAEIHRDPATDTETISVPVYGRVYGEAPGTAPGVVDVR